MLSLQQAPLQFSILYFQLWIKIVSNKIFTKIRPVNQDYFKKSLKNMVARILKSWSAMNKTALSNSASPTSSYPWSQRERWHLPNIEQKLSNWQRIMNMHVNWHFVSSLMSRPSYIQHNLGSAEGNLRSTDNFAHLWWVSYILLVILAK